MTRHITGMNHFRFVGEDHQLSATGGVSFGYDLFVTKEGPNGPEFDIVLSFAACSQKDNFNKKIGYNLVVDRINHLFVDNILHNTTSNKFGMIVPLSLFVVEAEVGDVLGSLNQSVDVEYDPVRQVYFVNEHKFHLHNAIVSRIMLPVLETLIGIQPLAVASVEGSNVKYLGMYNDDEDDSFYPIKLI